MAGQSPQPYRSPPSAYVLVFGFCTTAIVGLITTHVLDSSKAGLIAAAAFGAVISAAMVISWGAEAAQFFISQGFAVALIALLQVMPEFMVEAVISWHGDVKNMFANATGSNRLLIGLGWPLIFFTADITNRMRTGSGIGYVQLRRVNVVEVLSLFVASLYYVKLFGFGVLTIFDGVFLILMYVGYMLLLSRLPEEEDESKEDLIAPARMLAEIQSPLWSRGAVFGLFLVGGGVMAFVSEPFVGSLKHVAVGWGISEFSFIQWVAPFLSEFPEKVTAFYWSRKVRLAPMAMINMISSTVSQFTLLVGMIPLVYAAAFWLGNFPKAHAGLFGLPVVPMVIPGPEGHDLTVEVFLSWAMTLLGCAQLAKLRFGLLDASIIFAIWIAQFAATPLRTWTGVAESTQHWGEGFLCIALAVVELVVNRKQFQLGKALQETVALLRGASHTERETT
jgi:cation:H+ antiporter